MARYQAFPRLGVFDRQMAFKVRRAIKIGGRLYQDGDYIDKDTLSTRRLRQLFEQRFVVAEEPVVDEGIQPKFEEMSTEAAKDWLQRHGIVCRARWKRTQILEAARRHWAKEHADDVPA